MMPTCLCVSSHALGRYCSTPTGSLAGPDTPLSMMNDVNSSHSIVASPFTSICGSARTVRVVVWIHTLWLLCRGTVPVQTYL